MTIYTTKIDNYEVSFEFTPESKNPLCYIVSFTINNSFSYVENIDKGVKFRITKWLLITWNKFLKTHTYTTLVCIPSSSFEESCGVNYRSTIYKRVGFKPFGNLGFMYYGVSPDDSKNHVQPNVQPNASERLDAVCELIEKESYYIYVYECTISDYKLTPELLKAFENTNSIHKEKLMKLENEARMLWRLIR